MGVISQTPVYRHGVDADILCYMDQAPRATSAFAEPKNPTAPGKASPYADASIFPVFRSPFTKRPRYAQCRKQRRRQPPDLYPDDVPVLQYEKHCEQ
jgi:hypothetical protein